MQYLIDHETLSTWCHVDTFVHLTFFGSFSSQGLAKSKLDSLWLLDQSHNLYTRGQGPSSSSVKWP